MAAVGLCNCDAATCLLLLLLVLCALLLLLPLHHWRLLFQASS